MQRNSLYNDRKKIMKPNRIAYAFQYLSSTKRQAVQILSFTLLCFHYLSTPVVPGRLLYFLGSMYHRYISNPRFEKPKTVCGTRSEQHQRIQSKTYLFVTCAPCLSFPCRLPRSLFRALQSEKHDTHHSLRAGSSVRVNSSRYGERSS
jgi:hypothetical protein